MNSKKRKFKCVAENLYVRNSVYYAIIKIHGKQTWRALTEAIDKNTALAERDKLKEELRSGFEFHDKKSIPTFKEAATILTDICKQRGMKIRTLESLSNHLSLASESFLGNLNIADIKSHQIQNYLDTRHKTRSGRTVNLDLIHLRKLFKFASKEKKWRWDDPTKGIESYPHTEKEISVPSQDEINKVIKTLRTYPIRNGKKAADFIEFLQLSGVRLEEAQNALRSKINLQKNFMEIKGKGDKWRIIDLFPNLRIFLEQLMQNNKSEEDDRLFPPLKGIVYDPRKALEIGCKKAEVPIFGFHGLRHAWATHLVELGIDYATIAKWMGHQDGGILVAIRYGKHSRREHFQSTARRVIIGSVTKNPAPAPLEAPSPAA